MNFCKAALKKIKCESSLGLLTSERERKVELKKVFPAASSIMEIEKKLNLKLDDGDYDEKSF